MKKDKKPFKDSKLGKFLKDKAPNILNVVGDLLPDNGALGIVKNLISNDSTIAPEDKEKALGLLKIELEAFELEVKDRANARNREIEMAKTGKTDWMMYLAGLIGLGSFVFTFYAVTYLEIPEDNKEMFHFMLGIVDGAIVNNIFNYYFGSSKNTK